MSVILPVPEQILLKALHSVRRQNQHKNCHLAKLALAYVHAAKALVLCISADTHIHNAKLENYCKMYIEASNSDSAQLIEHTLCNSIINNQEEC